MIIKNLQVLEKINEEDLTFLKELSEELRTQDNSATATPVIFKIREPKIITCIDEEFADGMCVIDEEGDVYTNASEFKSHIEDNYCDKNTDTIEKLAESVETEVDINDLKSLYDLIILYNDTYFYVGYCEEYQYIGEFITKESANKHLEENRYRYHKDSIIYATHSFRNPILEKLLDIVKKF